MNLQFVNSLPEDTWRSFVQNHPNGNIFHTPEMYHVFKRARGHQPQLFAVVNGDGQVLALVTPVLVSLRQGLLRGITTRSIAYGGALYTATEDGRSAFDLLLRECASRTHRLALFTELRNMYDMGPVKETLSACGYAYEDHLNYLIDITGDPEQVMQNINSHTRRNIRSALKKGCVTIEQVHQASQLPIWYSLIQKTYQNVNVPLADISLFHAAFDILVPKGMARFYLARTEEAYVAAMVELTYKEVIYGWYHGIDRAVNGMHAGELLMWEILCWGNQNDYKIYDWGGAGKPSEPSGVREFKAKFGGKLVCYGRNTKIYAPRLLEVSKWGYEVFRELQKVFHDRIMNKRPV